MGVLNVKKRELFAQGIADGMTQDDAYVTAGYSPKCARQGASLLLKKDPSIKKRAAELVKEKGEMTVRAGMIPSMKAAQTLGIDKERLLKELWDNAMQAKAAIPVIDREGNEIGIYNANWNASNKALELIGKEFGMFMPKEEHAVNEYANKSTKEIIQAMVNKCAKLGIKIEVPAIEGESIRID